MRRFDNCVFALSDAQREELAQMFAQAKRVLERYKGGVMVQEGADAVGLQMLKGRLELFLLGLYAAGGGKTGPAGRNEYRKQTFRRVSSYMKQNLSKRLTLSDIAAACSLSEASLKGLCREFCGCGPIEYLISLRILAAKELIREGNMNFTEIAACTGFVTLHYFSRVSKSRTGMSPRAYAVLP
jgi:transcriptional regulator GlxA family with amidase domain